jgi:hypothetical protein
MRYLYDSGAEEDNGQASILELYNIWASDLMKVMQNSFVIHRNSFFDNPTTMGHLGKA